MPIKCKKTRAEYSKSYHKIWYEKNKESRKEQVKEYKTNSKDKVKEGHLKYKYGLTLTDYNKMLGAQADVCYVCLRYDKENTRSLAVDHCHATGKIRKLLCANCNRALGLLKENLETVLQLAQYIKEHNES